ncbi:hypothetical protein EBR03_01055 [bacterium]|nr:hypothetical protein [bacterium]NBX81794.1 hypothetical protein [bacterium]
MKTFFALSCFIFTGLALSDAGLHEKTTSKLPSNVLKKASRPLANDAFDLEGIPLTAAEVMQGDWAPDEEGGCDLVKGCAYKNKKTGEVRYISEAEKKKLAIKKEEASQEESPSKSSGIKELKDQGTYEAAFTSSTDKKALVMVFSAEDCPPCRALKSKLQNGSFEDLAIYTATRPSYRSVSGHPLHEDKKAALGAGVPVAFIYTKDENGKWQGKTFRGSQIFPAIEAVNSP